MLQDWIIIIWKQISSFVFEEGTTENTFKSKLNKGFSFFWHTAYC